MSCFHLNHNEFGMTRINGGIENNLCGCTRLFFSVNNTHGDHSCNQMAMALTYVRGAQFLLFTHTMTRLRCQSNAHLCVMPGVDRRRYDTTCYIHSQFWWQNVRHWAPVADHSITSLGFSPLPPWWRHQMQTFSMLMALCEGNHLVDFTSQRPVTWSF